MRRILAVMADAPIPGEVKTGMCPPLDPVAAARLHECFLLDTLDRGSAVPDTELVVAYQPRGCACYFRDAAPDVGRLIPQAGESLSQRLSAVFDQLCEPGAGVVAVGTDTPTLPVRSLELAFNALAAGSVDLVFGPISGGGCYLIGMTRFHPELFSRIDWSGKDVLRASVELAALMGLGWFLLPEWHDIELPTDLIILRSELEEFPSGPRRTRQLFAAPDSG